MYYKLIVLGLLVLNHKPSYASKNTTHNNCQSTTVTNSNEKSDIEKTIDGGYKDLDGSIRYFLIGNTKLAIKFEANTAEDVSARRPLRDRGTVRLVFKAESIHKGAILFGQILDLFLQEPEVTRGAFSFSGDAAVSSRSIGLYDNTGKEYVDLLDGEIKEHSDWVDQEIYDVYSNLNINAQISKDNWFNPKELRYSGLKLDSGGVLVSIRTHPGREESENSERLFRALHNYRIPYSSQD